MQRRTFLKNISTVGGAAALFGPKLLAREINNMPKSAESPLFDPHKVVYKGKEITVQMGEKGAKKLHELARFGAEQINGLDSPALLEYKQVLLPEQPASDEPARVFFAVAIGKKGVEESSSHIRIVGRRPNSPLAGLPAEEVYVSVHENEFFYPPPESKMHSTRVSLHDNEPAPPGGFRSCRMRADAKMINFGRELIITREGNLLYASIPTLLPKCDAQQFPNYYYDLQFIFDFAYKHAVGESRR